MQLLNTTSIDDLDLGEWDRLAAPRSFYMASGWLRFQENIEPELRCRYLVVHDSGRYLAATPVYVTERPGNRHYNTAALFPGATPAGPQALAGSTRGYHNRLLLDDSLPAGRTEAALRALVDAVRAEATAGGADRVWWLYLDDQSVRLLTPLLATTPKVLGGDCQIDLPEGGYERYLASTGRRRQKIRRDEERFVDAGYVVQRLRLSQLLPVASRLIGQTQRRYGFDVDDAYLERLLRIQCEATRDQAIVYTCELDGEVLGCCLTYSAGRTIYARAVGFDYPRLQQAGEYFSLTYYQPIRDAYRRGLRTLHLGKSAYQAKALRGASIRPLWAVCDGPQAWSEEAARRHNSRYRREVLAESPGAASAIHGELWTELSEDAPRVVPRA